MTGAGTREGAGARGKPVRWSPHAEAKLAAREIDRSEADAAVTSPEFVVPSDPPRRVHLRRYFDRLLDEEMLLRVVVEETADELVVVTLYKTSRIAKYLQGLEP